MKSHHAYQLATMKGALVEHILTSKISVTEAARSVKKSRVTLYDWMTRYKETGIDGLFRSGGMPSSHSAFVTSLLIVVGWKAGPESIEFAIAFVFACLVWYDAVSSRHAIGEQAKILNRLQKWEHLTERLGHSFKEVI